MNARDTVIVWDPLVRLFHWSLVTAYTVAWATGDDWPGPHEVSGYVILALVLFRVAWGIAGPRHARFADFVRPPREVVAYLLDVASFRARRHLGHNPAGGMMIVLLLVTLTLTSLTGILMDEGGNWMAARADGVEWEGDEGSEFLEEAHEFLANFSLLLVGLHLVGVAVASFQHRENLVRAMFTGRKPRATIR